MAKSGVFKYPASSTPNPSTTCKNHIDELKPTIATQNHATSIFQSQVTSLKSSHEAHVASLLESHKVEVASLKNHIRALEDQSIKHALRNSSLSVLNTTETPHTPTHKTTLVTVDPASASSIESEGEQRSPQRLEAGTEMENLKRKLSSTRRPETTTRNLLPELNQYKQNNLALQQQIESLMAKLTESKKSERELRNILGMTEMKCAEFEDKAAHADKLAKSMQALQNTINHLESRLEVANTERLDAEEQLLNLRNQKSPFDLSIPKSQVSPSTCQAAFDAHMSTSTIFSGASPTSLELDSQENTTLAAFVVHVERLQDQLREKDAYIASLEKELEQLRPTHSRLEQDQEKIAIHSDIQESRRADTDIELLRAAVLNRESVIQEKDRTIHAVERQLEHHKLLLQAEIRRHAAMELHMATEGEDSWPELTSLARREDVDRWIDRLHDRLRREQSKKKGEALLSTPDVQLKSFRKEIDFYVREIILFKLDIRGYKSDIRKLKKITAQMEACGRTNELESAACSLRQTATPVHSQSMSPELSEDASPVIDDNHTKATTYDPRGHSVTLSQQPSSRNLDYEAAPRNSCELNIPAMLHETAHRDSYETEADRMDRGVPSHTQPSVGILGYVR
ncbi:hypothetical protein G6011_10761 [Alternaria panax]|uniref:Uncharacterized protein n=1 Tax=Alternaria panax TaxID=48097 RepID=A0AAD4IC76_9PLEO|nr:hypothetical protein G6011_10761 [Alternaria panax]